MQRAALEEVNSELRADTETLARNVSRQIRLIQEATRLFKVEVGSAGEVMEGQISAFGMAADSLAERTAQMQAASQTVSTASSQLEDSIGTALDALGQATSMTDAARQNTEAAAVAAHATAQAVRDATQKAIADARRAAQAVREEAQSMEEAAAGTLARLHEAAQAARAASEDSQAAADRHAASIEKRLGALAATAEAARRAPPPPQAKPAPAPIRDWEEEEAFEPAMAAVGARRQAAAPAPRVTQTTRPPTRTFDFAAQFAGIGKWGNLTPENEFDDVSIANERGGDADPFGFSQASAPEDQDAALIAQAFQACFAANVRPQETLSGQDLERIAARARYGATARRRAVNDAAGAAVQRLARHLKRSAQARAVANDFRARPDLAKVSRKGENTDVVCAYLLIDAALA
jgi:hypothetical protein